jgi:hypothetical protein
LAAQPAWPRQDGLIRRQQYCVVDDRRRNDNSVNWIAVEIIELYRKQGDLR